MIANLLSDSGTAANLLSEVIVSFIVVSLIDF